MKTVLFVLVSMFALSGPALAGQQMSDSTLCGDRGMVDFSSSATGKKIIRGAKGNG